MQMAYNRANRDSTDRVRNNSSIRSRKSSPGVDKTVPDINDQMRVQMAKDLSNQLTADLNLPNFEAYKDKDAIIAQLKGQNLVILANQLASEYDGDLMALD